MKKIMAVVVVVMLGAIPVFSQSTVKQAVKIPLEQVPMSVRQAYEKDFGAIPQDGYWIAFVESSPSGLRTAAKPMWYSYNNKKSKRERIEIKFSPSGEITSVKGVESDRNVSEQNKEKSKKDSKKIS